jgi:phosphoglycerate dehydrogenase-like enzyme
MSERLRVWCNWAFTAEVEARLREQLVHHDLVYQPGVDTANADLQSCHVAFGRPAVDSLLRSDTLRWVHVASAGYTPWDRSDLWQRFRDRRVTFTRSSRVYAEPCAEHVLALMLLWARRLPLGLAAQRSGREWRYREMRDQSRLLLGQRAVIVGLGSIGLRLCELLGPFHMQLSAVRDSVVGDEPVPTVSLGDPRLSELLAAADHVINLLPLNATTERAFDLTRLQAIRRGAVFYNIGRGGTVDQQALLSLLASDHFGAVLLDVVEPEPLPADHPLWQAKNCFVTPHSAGGHHDEQERLLQHFLINLGHFERGEPLLDRVV